MASAPVGRSAIDRIGRRLRAGEQLDDADRSVLERFRQEHQVLLRDVDRRIREEIGVEPTTRVKTLNTLVEKLRREQHLALSSVQDVAGARIVVLDGHEQQRIAEQICALFDGVVSPRTAEGSSGYSALHVLARVDNRRVEIQVRTGLQDLWANLFEGLADRWGRQIRYGGDPDDPATPVLSGALTRAQVVGMLRELGEVIDESTLIELDLARSAAGQEESKARIAEMRAALAAVPAPGLADKLRILKLRSDLRRTERVRRAAERTLPGLAARLEGNNERVRAALQAWASGLG